MRDGCSEITLQGPTPRWLPRTPLVQQSTPTHSTAKSAARVRREHRQYGRTPNALQVRVGTVYVVLCGCKVSIAASSIAGRLPI